MVLAEDLKKAVLQYAVEGKLTKQLSTDSNVDELIVKIKEEKAELEKRKKARKEAPYPEISDDEKEFEIPENWRWIRLGEIGVYKKGPFGSALTKSIFVPKSEHTVKVYEQKNAIQKDASLGEYYITKEYYDDKMSGFTLESGDIIVSCAGTIGETYIMPDNIELGIINQALMRMNIADSIDIDYFLIYFDHILKKNAKRSSNGSAIKNIPPFEVFKKMLLPLPPIEEQRRIVERVNVVMDEIDEYGLIESQLIDLKDEFPYKLEKAILQYALQGKLTNQNDGDTSVDSLLANIDKNRCDLIKEKQVKNEKYSVTLPEESILYEIPDNWRWRKFFELCNLVSGSDMKPTEYNDKGLGIPYLTGASNIDDDGNIIINRWVEKPRSIAKKGDLLLTCKGTVGKMAFLEQEEVHIARQIMAIQPYGEINKKYIFYCVLNYVFYLKRKAKSMIPGIDRELVLNLAIPVPPVEEQQRIVDKLNEVLPLCDDLKL